MLYLLFFATWIEIRKRKFFNVLLRLVLFGSQFMVLLMILLLNAWNELKHWLWWSILCKYISVFWNNLSNCKLCNLICFTPCFNVKVLTQIRYFFCSIWLFFNFFFVWYLKWYFHIIGGSRAYFCYSHLLQETRDHGSRCWIQGFKQKGMNYELLYWDQFTCQSCNTFFSLCLCCLPLMLKCLINFDAYYTIMQKNMNHNVL